MPAGVYEKMKFPEYEYQPYPKWVTLKDGSQQLAATQREHLEIVAKDGTEVSEDNPLQRERDALLLRMGELERELLALKATPLHEAAAKLESKTKPKAPAATLSIDDLVKP
jgi:hypothetical protein